MQHKKAGYIELQNALKSAHGTPVEQHVSLAIKFVELIDMRYFYNHGDYLWKCGQGTCFPDIQKADTKVKGWEGQFSQTSLLTEKWGNTHLPCIFWIAFQNTSIRTICWGIASIKQLLKQFWMVDHVKSYRCNNCLLLPVMSFKCRKVNAVFFCDLSIEDTIMKVSLKQHTQKKDWRFVSEQETSRISR